VVLPCFANLWLASFRSVKGRKDQTPHEAQNNIQLREADVLSLPSTDALNSGVADTLARTASCLTDNL